jgi:hypothetical protein
MYEFNGLSIGNTGNQLTPSFSEASLFPAFVQIQIKIAPNGRCVEHEAMAPSVVSQT